MCHLSPSCVVGKEAEEGQGTPSTHKSAIPRPGFSSYRKDKPAKLHAGIERAFPELRGLFREGASEAP